MKNGIKNVGVIGSPWLTKSMVAEVKDVDTKKGIICGYASKFGNIDSDGDMVMPGAFTKTIQENGPTGKNRIVFLKQHNPYEPLGKPQVLREDGYGLYFEAPVSQTSYGKDTLILYEDKVIDEHSIGYRIIKWEDGEDHLKLVELKLWEFSAVTWGANEATPVTDIKTALGISELQTKLDRLNKCFKTAKFENEDMYIQLEIAINQIKAAIASLETKEPHTSTQEVEEPVDYKSIFESFKSQFKN